MAVSILLLVVAVAVTLVCEGAGETHKLPSQVVCLSRSTRTRVTLRWPEACRSGKLVIVDHIGRELLMWHPPCNATVLEAYKKRVITTCYNEDAAKCRLEMQMSGLTMADKGELQCRDGGLTGPLIPQCGVFLNITDVKNLRDICSYTSGTRTVLCEGLNAEVKVCRNGEGNDRDLRYSMGPSFKYQLPGHEYGRYSVVRTNKSLEDGQCSQDLNFSVEAGADSTRPPSLLLLLLLPLLLLVWLCAF